MSEVKAGDMKGSEASHSRTSELDLLPGTSVRQSVVHYDVVAFPITIYYNREGDHDPNGMMFLLCDNLPILEYIRALA
jgi:hypothetical protein